MNFTKELRYTGEAGTLNDKISSYICHFLFLNTELSLYCPQKKVETVLTDLSALPNASLCEPDPAGPLPVGGGADELLLGCGGGGGGGGCCDGGISPCEPFTVGDDD